MAELPEKIDLTYITKINPASQGAAEVARAVNKLIEYLQERGPALDAFIKPMDEIVDRKLGPHPDVDPDLRRH